MQVDEATPMTTAAVASAAGCSAQQVRDLEARGVIPVAVGSPNGYRWFTADHVRHLRAYRDLAYAVVRELDDASDSLAALDARLDSIAHRTLALLCTGSLLAEIIRA